MQQRQMQARRNVKGNALITLVLVVGLLVIGFLMLGGKPSGLLGPEALVPAKENSPGITYIGWYEDKPGYDKALADQKETGKPILLYFYATWCPHCRDFSDLILETDEMHQFLQNYPHVRVAPDNGEAEKALMAEYGVHGYPTFFVVMPKQRPILVETYVEGPPARLKTPNEFKISVLKVTEGQ